jgi:polysaccharide export outer membrane protein
MTRITRTVGRDGMVELPVLGRIPVAGVTPDRARQAVVQACYKEGVGRAPLVQVTLQKPRQHHVTVTGAVQRPGVYSLSRQESDLVSALAMAGGLANDAGTKIVIQSRPPDRDGDSVNGPVALAGAAGDLSAIAALDGSGERREIHLNAPGGGSLAREELRDGDVVLVERHEPASVVVTGMVNQPGRYPLPVGQEYRILDAIADAHGVSIFPSNREQFLTAELLDALQVPAPVEFIAAFEMEYSGLQSCAA